MKERPILFSAPMVRAILAGTKTQTRRALAPDLFMSSGGAVVRMASAGPATTGIREAHCPYWREPGDRLYVKETGHWKTGDVFYRAGTEHYSAEMANAAALVALGGDRMRWQPAIHMPRWASRITLEITGVRVERLQDISEADAKAEGIEARYDEWRNYGNPMAPCIRPRTSFATLWASINGPGSWDANPWCWVIEFRRVS